MDSPSLVRASQVPSFLLLKDIGFSSSVSAVQTTLKPVATSMPSPPNSRPTSPYSRRPSPTHAVSPMFSESIIDSLKKTNEFLNLEVLKLQAQVKSFQQRCGLKDVEVEKYERKAKKSASLATEVSSKYTATLEVIRSLVVQLKDIVEKQEPDVNYLRAMLIDAESLLIAKEINISESAIPLTSTTPAEDQMEDPGYGVDLPPNTVLCSSRDHSEEKIVDTSCNIPHVLDSKEVLPTDNEPRSPQMSTSIHNNDGREIIEQFEPGVYITVVLLHNGIKAFKRVKFSKRRFAEQQAEDWWRQNKDRVFKKYSNRGMDSSHAPYTQLKTASAAEEDDVVPSHP